MKLDRIKEEGEAETLPPSPSPAGPPKRDWPMLLAHAMCDSRWQLVNVPGGRLYSRVDPLAVLEIGGRYELSHRHLREALLNLGAATVGRLRAYLHRGDTWERDTLGRWRGLPPAMMADEAHAFDRLWRVLVERGWLI